jgi:hypothetical protein
MVTGIFDSLQIIRPLVFLAGQVVSLSLNESIWGVTKHGASCASKALGFQTKTCARG